MITEPICRFDASKIPFEKNTPPAASCTAVFIAPVRYTTLLTEIQSEENCSKNPLLKANLAMSMVLTLTDLLYCKRFDNTVVSTEYLDYSPDTVHGMLLDGEGFISVITEETYDQGRLMRFLQCSYMPTDDGFYCHQAYCEEYEYDEAGLCYCKTQNLLFPLPDTSIFLKSTFPQSTQWPVYCSDEFLFQRADGYLSGYTCGQQTYRISVRRKA